MTIKRVLVAVLVAVSSIVSAQFKGLEQAMTVFAPEIGFVNAIATTVEKKGTLSPIIDSSFVAFVRKHRVELAAETELFFEMVRGMYADPAIMAAVTESRAAMRDFIYDPLLMKTGSGKEIIALASYKKFKAADEHVKVMGRPYYDAAAPQMPLLAPIINRVEKYAHELFFQRIERALSVISWTGTLEEALDDLRESNPAFNDMVSQFDVAIRYGLSEQYITQVSKAAEPVKNFFIAVLACCGNDTIMRTLRTLRVVRTAKDQQINADNLITLLAEDDVQNLMVAVEQFAQAVPTVA